MKVQHTVSILFTLPEFHLIGRLLDQQPQRKLCPALAKLQEGIAAAIDAQIPELVVDFPQDALYALSSLLMQQDGLSLENRGIDSGFAYDTAKTITDAFALLLRTQAGPLTRGEKSDVSVLLRDYSYYRPVPTVPSFEEIARQLFGDDVIVGGIGDDAIITGIDASGIGPDDEPEGPSPVTDPSLN